MYYKHYSKEEINSLIFEKRRKLENIIERITKINEDALS